MTLAAATLSSEFIKVIDPENAGFVGWPATVADSCVNWGNAYHAYASQATDVSGDALVTANLPLFISTLQASLPAAAVGTAALAANAFDLAFIAYWTAAIFAIGAPPTPAAVCPSIGGTMLWSLEITSLVTAVVPAVLKGLLLPEFAIVDVATTAQEKADSLAQAFHTATTTAIMVLITGLDTTVPIPLPITNLCTIF